MQVRSYILLLGALALLSCAGQPASAPVETPEAKQARMEWFSQAKLGIFIHWGIYAVDGVSESWSFYNKYLPYEQYMAQKDGFTAGKYDPAGWAELIRESGAKYTVITSKHPRRRRPLGHQGLRPQRPEADAGGPRRPHALRQGSPQAGIESGPLLFPFGLVTPRLSQFHQG